MLEKFSISLSNPSRTDTNDFVRLEQEPWDPYIGALTRFGVLAFLNSIAFSGPEPDPYCGGDNFSLEVYAYPSRPDLKYLIGCSWGKLGDCRPQELLYTEAIQCNLELEPKLKYPALEVTKFAWVGDAWSPTGEQLQRPSVTIDGTGIRIAEKVYGTLLVTYKVRRDRYWLALSPRPGAQENKLQSFVYACWNGGNTHIEIKSPEGAEAGECNNAWSSSMDIVDDRQPPDHVDPDDEYVDVDYCSGLPIVYV